MGAKEKVVTSPRYHPARLSASPPGGSWQQCIILAPTRCSVHTIHVVTPESRRSGLPLLPVLQHTCIPKLGYCRCKDYRCVVVAKFDIYGEFILGVTLCRDAECGAHCWVETGIPVLAARSAVPVREGWKVAQHGVTR